MLPGASRVGTVDPMGKTRVYTDETLKEVPAGSAEAAFVWNRSDLEARREKRHTLGLDKNDEALRVIIASRKAEVATVERRVAALKAELESLQADIAEAEKAEKAAAKGTASASADAGDTRTPKQRLQDEARELGVDPEGTVDELKERIAEARASST